jgi:hypothetical protein
MRHFAFPSEVLAALRYDRYHHPHPRVQQKMEVLWLKSQGCTHQDIAPGPGPRLGRGHFAGQRLRAGRGGTGVVGGRTDGHTRLRERPGTEGGRGPRLIPG